MQNNYDASKNSVEKTPAKKAESDQVGTMLMGKDGSVPGMSGGHAGTVENSHASRKRIIIISAAAVAVVAIIATIFIVLNGMRVDYSASYQIAKDLRGNVQAMRADEDCKKVIANADVTYIKMETFMGYVENCKNISPAIDELAEKLGKTEGIKRNGNVEQAYNSFKDSFAVVRQGDEELEAALEDYQVWHTWVIAKEKVEDWDTSDTDLLAAAKILTESSNADFKKYGQTWYEKRQKASTAYRAFHYSDILAKNRSELLKSMNAAQKEYADWEAKNALVISETVDLSRADTAKVYTDFEAMYNLIKENYEQNYNHGSNDCLETLTDVVCD